MTRPCRICVVGSANVDLTFRTPRLPKAGETLAGHALHIGMGGKGANQAVAAARLGAEVALVACVGNDSFAADVTRQFQREGIDTSFIRQDASRPTGTAARNTSRGNARGVSPGAHGSRAFIANVTETTHIPIMKVDAVDTTGTGDAFTAAFAVSLADGLTLHEAARQTSLVAALTVTRIGTQSAFPHRAEVDQRMLGGLTGNVLIEDV